MTANIAMPLDPTGEIRVLQLEDDAADAELVRHALTSAGIAFEAHRVDTAERFVAELDGFVPDIVLADFTLPRFDGLAALGLVRERHPEIPVIIVTGTLHDESATSLLRAGAKDFILKDRLARLGPAVRRAIEEELGVRARKAAEKAVRESESRYRRMFEAASDAMLIMDARSGVVADANSALEKTLGRTRQQLLGSLPWETEAFEGAPELAAAFREALARGQLHRDGLQLRRPDGKTLDVELNCSAYAAGDGYFVQCNIRDISDRKRAERALAASEVRFRTLIENASDIVLTADADGTIRYMTPAVMNIAGIDPADVVGRSVFDFAVPAERDQVAAIWQQILASPSAVIRIEQRYQNRDGTMRLAEVVAQNLLATPEIGGVVVVMRDVTERRQAEQALAQSEERFRALIENASDIVVVVDRGGTIRYVSPSVVAHGGFEPEHFVGHSMLEFIHPDDATGAAESVRRLLDSPGAIARSERRYRTADGGWRTFETLSRNLLDAPAVQGIVITMRDVSERKAIEDRLRLANLVVEQSPSVLFRWRNEPDWPVVYVSQNVRQWGYEADDLLLGRPPYANLVHADDLPRVIEQTAQALSGGATHLTLEYRIVTPDGAVKWVDERSAIERDAAGTALFFQGIVVDVTERRKAQDALQQALQRVEAQLAAVGYASKSDALMSGDVEVFAREITELAARSVGVERVNAWLFSDDETELHCIDMYETVPARHSAGIVLHEHEFANEFEVLKRSPYVAVDDAQHDPRTAGYVDVYLKPANIVSMLDVVIRAAGRNLGLLCFEQVARPRHWEQDEIAFACQLADKIGFAILAGRRRQMEQQLHRANRALRTLSAGNGALVHAADESELYRQMCRLIVESGGYRMAWVGLAADDVGRTVTVAAQAGSGERYLETARLTWGDDQRGRGPGGLAIREGLPQIVRNIAADRRFEPWKEAAAAEGYAAVIALPLRAEDRVFGMLAIYAAEVDAFDPEEVSLLVELAGDLSYGVANLRARAAQEASVRRLNESMEATVYAVAGTVEMRDPYTAGHQRRVAALSVAIARELGLSEDRIHGLRLAATIHDVGKIMVPAEILSRPARLNPIEYEVVKQHAQAGYEIVKDVKFPWPIAETIRQHHERLDGSGYPRGLKGDDILLEARILAVADVAESIASHRPYRPALGLDVALRVIAEGSGSLFDAAVADACQHLFRDKAYTFQS